MPAGGGGDPSPLDPPPPPSPPPLDHLPPSPPPPPPPPPLKQVPAIRGRPAVRGKKTYGGRLGQRVEEQGTWASRTQKHSEAGYGQPVDRGTWTAKTAMTGGTLHDLCGARACGEATSDGSCSRHMARVTDSPEQAPHGRMS